MNHLTKAGFAIAVGTAVLTATPDAKALNYSYGFSGTSSVSGSTYTLTSNPSSFTCSEGCSAFSDVLTAFGSFVYKINKLSATSAEWASPLTIALNPTATFGNSITFFNPITTFTAPNGTSFFTSDYKTDSGLSGELVSFTVNTTGAFGGTLSGVPGPLPAAGVVAGLSFARQLRRKLKATV
ncbi:MAG: hypothetical protein EB059_08210 [Alphaproteobacteria bacterium]|nr:hypothetical protein [Alphaproteobacteria bacterium]